MIIYSTGGRADFGLGTSLSVSMDTPDTEPIPPTVRRHVSDDVSRPSGGGLNHFEHHFQNDPRPKFILDLSGRVLSANLKGQALLHNQTFLQDSQGRLAYGSGDQTAHVNRLIKALGAGRAQRKCFLKRQSDDTWLALEFSYMALSRTDDEILLIVKRKGECREPALDALAQAFSFTITESKVVGHMSEALCPKEIAGEMNISVNTVRAHLRSIYSKTGVRGYNGTLKLILQLIV